MQDEAGNLLVERGWTINVWEDLPIGLATISTRPRTNIADYSALGSNNGSVASVDRTTYLSFTITASNTGSTVTITAQRYKITAEDGTVTYAAWNAKPAEGTYASLEVEECKWQLKIAGHTYLDEGVVTKQPACTERGELTTTCSLCHTQTQTEDIPALHAGLGEGEACSVCGKVLFRWNEASKTLTFTADIPDFQQSEVNQNDPAADARPYAEYASVAERVVIADGVTKIGSYAFTWFEKLTAFGPADTPAGEAVVDVPHVGGSAFWNVHGMTKYTFTEKVEVLGTCLYNCGTLETVTLESTPKDTNGKNFVPYNLMGNSSTVIDRLIVNAPDGVFGQENINNTMDNVRSLTLNVGTILGSVRAGDLEELVVTGAQSIPKSWMGRYTINGMPVSPVENLKSLTLSGIGVVCESAFYGCSSLTSVTITDVGLIDAYVFSGCTSLQGLEVPEETKLGYSDIFDFTKPGFAALKDRMLGILDGRFELEENPAPDELTVPAGWTDFELGAQNEAALDRTQVTKAARWADTDRTQADVEFRFNYAKTQGMDFLFVVDYSGSMAKVGNYTDGTQPDDSVDDNSRFCDMQSKLLDVSEKLLGAEGYDNRVAFVTFATGLERTLDFTDSYSAVEQFVTGDYPYGSTNYSQALAGARAMINARTDTSREAAVIFISDGQPNKFYPEISGGKWNQLIEQINGYADEIKAIQQFGHDTKIFGVLQTVPAKDTDRCRQVLEGVCTEGLFFESTDTDSFSRAINNAVSAAYNVYTLTDEIDPAFTLDESSIEVTAGTYTVGTNAAGNTQITWTITGVPYLTHTMSYKLNLKPNADGSYPSGSFDTNGSDAVITQSGEQVNSVATPTLLRGTMVLQPADMTIYMGGDTGYEGVVETEGTTIITSQSLPQPGFYVTLPSEIDAMMKQVWKNSDDITEITSDGTTTYVLNLSNYVRLTDESAGKEWALSLYSSGYSLAYSKYVYRIEPVSEGMDPVRLQFIDEEGNYRTSDEFTLDDALYQTYTMRLYSADVESGHIEASLKVADDTWTTIPLELQTGTLTIRYVTGSHDAVVSPVVNDESQVTPGQAAAIVEEGTTFYINGSMIPADGASVSLLFDSVVDSATEGSDANYSQILRDTALEKAAPSMANPKYEAKYLDLVDADNGNVWLTADKPVTVCWPYPEGTNSGTQFRLVHFKGLDRDMAQVDLDSLIDTAETEVLDVTTGENGVTFTVDSFSPFVLLWEGPSDGGSASTGGDPQTGDSTPLGVWASLAVVGAAGAAGMLVLGRTKRSRKR